MMSSMMSICSTQVCRQLADAGDPRRAVRILHAAQEALALSPADAGTGAAVVRALRSQRAPPSVAAWALKVLPPAQESYVMLLHIYRTSGSPKVSAALRRFTAKVSGCWCLRTLTVCCLQHLCVAKCCSDQNSAGMR